MMGADLQTSAAESPAVPAAAEPLCYGSLDKLGIDPSKLKWARIP
jgi:hypothetical protein